MQMDKNNSLREDMWGKHHAYHPRTILHLIKHSLFMLDTELHIYIDNKYKWKKGQSKPTLAKDSAEGVPRRSVMRSNWCTTFLPGNNGFPVSISAKMHPMLQISIAGVYCKTESLRMQYWWTLLPFI